MHLQSLFWTAPHHPPPLGLTLSNYFPVLHCSKFPFLSCPFLLSVPSLSFLFSSLDNFLSSYTFPIYVPLFYLYLFSALSFSILLTQSSFFLIFPLSVPLFFPTPFPGAFILLLHIQYVCCMSSPPHLYRVNRLWTAYDTHQFVPLYSLPLPPSKLGQRWQRTALRQVVVC